MYGDRTDPAGALARLGARLQAVMLPGDVLPAVVETVAQSLRVPYVGIDLADGAGTFRVAAEHGVAVGYGARRTRCCTTGRPSAGCACRRAGATIRSTRSTWP